MSAVLQALGPKGFGNYQVTWTGKQPEFERVSRPADGVLLPGFVDIHIHGAFGIDFMSATSTDLLTLCEKLEQRGYEAFLPTTVTASAADVLSAVRNLPAHPAMAGFHLEGPFISADFPGAQPQGFIQTPPLGPSEWDEVFGHPLLRVVTLAPELPHALELASRLMKRGVVVSMGHTNATFEEARRGFEFGASQVTHMFNAMRPFHHRDAGMVGYALAAHGLAAELIYDRKHVSADATKLLFQCKSDEEVIAVSDGTMAAGMAPGLRIDMWGMTCVTGKGEVRTLEGALAGSAITLFDAFRNLAEDFGLETAIRSCCVNPRRALKMPEKPRVYVQMNNALEIVERWELAA